MDASGSVEEGRTGTGELTGDWLPLVVILQLRSPVF